VAVLEKFLKMGSRLFRRIQSTKRSQRLKEPPMSNSRVSELVKKELKSKGLDPSLYSPGQGVLRLQQHLRFQIEISDSLSRGRRMEKHSGKKKNYIQESLDSLQLVTRTIQGSG